MLKPEFIEYRIRGPGSTLAHIFEALSDGLMHIRAGCDVEKSLVGCGILQLRFRFPSYREHDGTLGLLELVHQVTGIAAERSYGMNIFGDVDHGEGEREVPAQAIAPFPVPCE